MAHQRAAPEALTTYRGNCHCGAYRFEVRLPEIKEAISCDCTLCAKKGYLWVVPASGDFKVTRDGGRLTKYQSTALVDQFCSECATPVVGEHSVGPLAGQFAINSRAILDVNPFEFAVKKIHVDDERKLQPLLPPPSGPPALHTGSCHCGNVRVELLCPLDEELGMDNCSGCIRIAQILTYPTRDKVRIHGKEHTAEYMKAPSWDSKAFCRTCGVSMFANIYGPPEGESFFNKVPEERREHVLGVYRKNMSMQPLQVRALDGIDIDSLQVTKKNTGTEGYELDL
ncbi:glutathione-dependent formaldehyde-activating enzyme [Thozetella sp. PMI_491]|nr:glutathione-dependent formaldehyde-activating enzyme [Thozetella sp. PMI_491]